jgi:peptidyl-prolyl cis-trans isomerase D
MLRVFRDNLQYLKWVLWLVVLVFVGFVFVGFGSIDLTAQGGSVTTPAAKVGTQEVSYAQFERAYRQVETQYREAYGQQFTRELANQLGLPMQVLNQLINERLVLQEAQRMGLDVTDVELRQAILAMPVFQRDGAFMGQQAYVDLLRANGLRPEDFEALQREALLTQKMQNALAQTVFVGPEEVEAEYRQQAETATVRLLRLPASQFADEVVVDETALGQFFDARREDFRLPERRVVDYLVVDPASLRESVAVEDSAVRAYYDAHPDDYTSEEQVKARHILLRTGAERTTDEARAQMETIKARVEGGEDFAALATELSDDPGSKARGGDLGFFSRGAMVKPFEDAAFGAEPGDLVGPLETSFGVHLIQVQARRPGGVQPFEEVAAGIRTRLVNEAAGESAKTQAVELASRAQKENPTTEQLQAMASQETGASAVTSEPFGRSDNVAGIGRATDFTTQAFELELNGVSQPIQVARGWAVLVLRQIQEPRLPELEDVRPQVTTAFEAQAEMELATARATTARAALAQGRSFDDLAADLGVSVEDAGPFGAKAAVGSLGQAPEVARRALALAEGEISEPIARDGEVVLFEVTARTYFDGVAFASEQESVRHRLESERANELLGSLIARRRDELGVTIDPRVFEVFAQNSQSAS